MIGQRPSSTVIYLHVLDLLVVVIGIVIVIVDKSSILHVCSNDIGLDLAALERKENSIRASRRPMNGSKQRERENQQN